MNLTDTPSGPTVRYLAPDAVSRRLANPIVAGLARLGLGLCGAQELHVRRRSSGDWQKVPVNPLELSGRTYLVAPRGQTQWVRNLRVAGEGRLRIGRRITQFSAVEVADGDKAPIIRHYLDRWSAEVGKFFDGLTSTSSDDEITAVAAGFPVFEITSGDSPHV